LALRSVLSCNHQVIEYGELRETQRDRETMIKLPRLYIRDWNGIEVPFWLGTLEQPNKRVWT